MLHSPGSHNLKELSAPALGLLTDVPLLPAGDRKTHPVGSQRDLSANVLSRCGCAYDHDRQPPEGRIVSIAVAVDDHPWELLSTRELRSPHIAVVPIADDHSVKVLCRCC